MEKYLRFSRKSNLAGLAVTLVLALVPTSERAMPLQDRPLDCIALKSDIQVNQFYDVNTGALTTIKSPFQWNDLVSPDKKHILKLVHEGNQFQFVIQDIDTGESFEANPPPSDPAIFNPLPLWSPDGKYLAYRPFVPYTATVFIPQIALFNLTTHTGRIIQLSPDFGEGFLESWSPDGAYLLIEEAPEPQLFAVVSASDDRPPIIISMSPYNRGTSSWWAGHLLAYQPETGKGLRILNPDTDTDLSLNIPTNAYVLDAHWSPDAQHLAVILAQESIVPRLYLYSPNSPDGKKVDNIGLASTLAAGSNYTRQDNTQSHLLTRWSADGHILYYAQDGDVISIMAYHTDTGIYERLSQFYSAEGFLSPFSLLVSNSQYTVFRSDAQTFKVLDLAQDRVMTLFTLEPSYQMDTWRQYGQTLLIVSHNPKDRLATNQYYQRLDLIDIQSGQDYRLALDRAIDIQIAQPGDSMGIINVLWRDANDNTFLDGYNTAAMRVFRFLPIAGQGLDYGQYFVSPDQSRAAVFTIGPAPTVELITSDQKAAKVIVTYTIVEQPAVAWSPDSTKIAVMTQNNQSLQIFSRDGTLIRHIEFPDRPGIPEFTWASCPQVF